MSASHCPHCAGTLDWPGKQLWVNTYEKTPCPGCTSCAEKEADLSATRAVLRRVVEAGDVMSMLFEMHWTVKDTDEAVHQAVAGWKDAIAAALEERA